MWLGSHCCGCGVARSCSSNSTPILGTSISLRCGPKKTKNKGLGKGGQTEWVFDVQAGVTWILGAIFLFVCLFMATSATYEVRTLGVKPELQLLATAIATATATATSDLNLI